MRVECFILTSSHMLHQVHYDCIRDRLSHSCTGTLQTLANGRGLTQKNMVPFNKVPKNIGKRKGTQKSENATAPHIKV